MGQLRVVALLVRGWLFKRMLVLGWSLTDTGYQYCTVTSLRVHDSHCCSLGSCCHDCLSKYYVGVRRGISTAGGGCRTIGAVEGQFRQSRFRSGVGSARQKCLVTSATVAPPLLDQRH